MYCLYSVFKKFIIILRFYSFIFILSLRNYSEDNFSRFHEELTFMSGLLLLISGLLHMFKVSCFITIFRYLNFSLESSIYCVRKDYYLCQKSALFNTVHEVNACKSILRVWFDAILHVLIWLHIFILNMVIHVHLSMMNVKSILYNSTYITYFNFSSR